MEFDKDTQKKIKELQNYEQNLHNLLIQKQAFEIELVESENAYNEVSKSTEDIHRLVGNILIKTDKKKVQEELKKRKDLITLRIKSIETQESVISRQLEELKKDVLSKIK